MQPGLTDQLTNIARERISDIDVSHDFAHTSRVLSNAQKIALEEGGDLDVIIPAALFHDLIVYPKDHPNRSKSQEESALETERILAGISSYPQHKIAD